MMNNPFLSTVKRMFGRYDRTYASSSCFTPKTEGEKHLAPALGKMQRICTFLPGSRFCIDVEEGRMLIAVNWTPRANESKHFGKHRFVIDATGGHETDADGHEADAGDTAFAGKRTDADGDVPAGSRAVTDGSTSAGNLTATGGKPVRREEAPESPSKTTGLVRRVTDYLTSRYYFRFNVLTEQTEYAERATYTEQPERKCTERATCTEQTEESVSHLTYIYIEKSINVPSTPSPSMPSKPAWIAGTATCNASSTPGASPPITPLPTI